LNGLSVGDEVVTGSYRAISKDLAHNKAVTTDEDKKEEKKGFSVSIKTSKSE